jgi:hypothetical protein
VEDACDIEMEVIRVKTRSWDSILRELPEEAAGFQRNAAKLIAVPPESSTE